jgi:hypothetical protein
VGAGDDANGGKAGPADQTEQNDEENGLNGCGNTEPAELGAIMDKEIAVAEQRSGHGQNLRHTVPAPKARQARESTPVNSSKSGAPQPQTDHADCPPRAGEANTAAGWLTNSTFDCPSRDEPQSNCGESFCGARFGIDSSKFNLLCSAALNVVGRVAANLSPWVAGAAFGLTNGVGPRRPNAARALWKESDID